MHSIPREQHSPLLAAALPGTESEAFLVSRDNAIATLAADDLRVRSATVARCWRDCRRARGGRQCKRRLARRSFI